MKYSKYINSKIKEGRLSASLTPKFCASVLGSMLAAVSAFGADVTITSSSSDYPNLSSVGPGDTIYLDAHTRERLVLQNFSGSAANPVRVINSGGQFVIDGGDNHGLIFNNATQFIVDGTGHGGYEYGIKIASTDVGAGLVVYGESSHFEIHNLEIQNTNFAGMLIKSPTLGPEDWLYDEISVHHNKIHHTEGEGIYIGDSFFTSGDHHYVNNCEIYENIVYETGWDGIQLGSCTEGASIHDNTIVSWGLTSPNYDQSRGIRWNPGTAGVCYNNVLIGATVSGQGAYANGGGIFANPYDDSAFFNNVVVDSVTEGITMSANHGMLSGTQVLIMNNTIVSPATYGIVFDPTNASGSLAYNNIIANPGNDYVDIGGGASLTESNNYESGTVAGVNFVDASNDDYRLSSSSGAIDYGTDVSSYGIADDILGVSRPQNSVYDAGAYEYEVSNTAPSVDAGSDDVAALLAGADDYLLDGTVTDDGLPNPPGSVALLWSKTSGPGTATFDDATSMDTAVNFSATGVYVLRLTADDDDLTAYDEVTITVSDAELDIIIPAGYGQAGAGYCPATGTFESQPSWDDVNEVPTGDQASAYAYTLTAYSSRYWYIDFGSNYADVRIVETWTRYAPYVSGAQGGFGAMWWDDDNDTTNDGTTESGLNWGSAGSPSYINQQQWIQDVDLGGSPITPQGRYLIIDTGPSPSIRANEFAIVGYLID